MEMIVEPKVKVHINASQRVMYHKTIEIPASVFAEYERMVERDDNNELWFSQLADRYLDQIEDGNYDTEYEDVEFTKATP